ncbi:amino acid biosynthesis protein [Companilactobacillus mishanensis]|uniref:Amino acid biosynthesis protein n=1 Tax=Companilactobacillus mishanensis TaxID=2486008 RepID=A0A5P0ZJD5_9LACO|nr:amino acid biosynthesis protein [Companilactobacillus mishanensis]MQS53148.1 amino acid biosynthesis protein [Companilactobacillus mishanensis]
MKIHTLGPRETDSYAAAKQYNNKECQGKAEIVGHSSFERILDNLTRYSNDYLLIPAAFKSKQMRASWGDIHYEMLDNLELENCFMTNLDPLVVVQRTDAKNDIGYTHAATAQLLEKVVGDVDVKTAASKYQAYQLYKDTDAEYVLTNEKNVALKSDERVIKRMTPSMVWCLYKIA